MRIVLAFLIASCNLLLTIIKPDDGVAAPSYLAPKFSGSSDPVPHDILVAENASFSVKCGRLMKFDVENPVTVEWFHNGRLLESQRSFSNSQTTDFTIDIKKAVLQHTEGSYRCLAKNRFGSVLSSRTNVQMAYLHPFHYVKSDLLQSTEDAHYNSYLILSPPKISAAPMEFIEWEWTRKNSHVVVPQSESFYVTLDGKLVILGINKEHSGQYAVEARHRLLAGGVKSFPVHVRLQEVQVDYVVPSFPIILLPPQDAFYTKKFSSNGSHDELTLECVAYYRDMKKLEINWFHNGSLIRPSTNGRFSLLHFNRRLVVKKPTSLRDGGVYTCEASTSDVPFYTDKKQAWVEIYSSPNASILADSDTVTVTLGTRLEFPCNTQGYPQPAVQWYFNGTPVENITNLCCGIENAMQKTATNSLSIRKVGAENLGVYQCEAWNVVGYSAIATAYLAIDGHINRDVQKVQLKNISIFAGDSVTLNCDEAPVELNELGVKWSLNDTDVSHIGIALNRNNSITVQNMDTTKVGFYTCSVLDSIFSRAFVTIKKKIEIINGPTNQSAVIGSNVEFPCQVSFDDYGTGHNFVRQWNFKDIPVTSKISRSLQILSDGRLVIKQVGPINVGPYSCVVTSVAGTQEKTGFLEVVEKPGMPLYVEARMVNNTLPAKVNITWARGFDGNSPIIKFSVDQRSLGNQNAWSDWENVVENVPKENQSFLIDNLKPSAHYQFRVVAYNRFGPGLPSQPSNNLVMPQQPPAAAPQNVAASARSSSTIMVQWQPPPPDQWNGDILGYVLRYRVFNYHGVPWLILNISDIRSRNHLLEELISWREYEIQVAAYNERGMGVFSKALLITTLEGAPTDHPSNISVYVINSTAVFISFVPPPQQMIPGVNLGYKVELWKNYSNHSTENEAVKMVKILPYSLSKIERIIDGLNKFGSYQITALCYTSQGNGPRSFPVNFTTKQDLPDPVRNLVLKDISSDSVTLSWEKSANPNGVLKNYTITCRAANETASKRTLFAPPDATFYKLADLTPSTKYFVEFFGSTEVGRGPVQNLDFISGVPPELPGPPTSLSISDLQPRTVILHFVPGFDGKTVILEWIVEALIGSSTNATEIMQISVPNAQNLTVVGLRPFTDYKLRLIAANVKGKSSPSNWTEKFQTMQTIPEAVPDDLEVYPLSSDSVKVTWTPLQSHAWNCVPFGYEIHWAVGKELGSSSTIQNDQKGLFLNDTASSEIQIRGLLPYTRYSVWIYAAGKIGRSLARFLSSKTYEAAPSEAPANFVVQNFTARSFTVVWDAVSKNVSNGIIAGYKLKIAPNLPNEVSKNFHILHVEAMQKMRHKFDGLYPSTGYVISIKAFTIAGNGPESQLNAFTEQDIPEQPSELVFPLVSVNEVRLTWKPPYRSNGIITHYSVAYWPNTTMVNAQQIRTTLNPDIFMFVATGILRDTPYTFAVAAETNAGWGPESKALVITSHIKQFPGSPSRPVVSQLQPPGPNHVTIQFDHDSNPMNRFFSVDYRQAGIEIWHNWPERGFGSTKISTIKNLKSSTAYVFRVRCVNDYGESRPSLQSDWIKTAEAPPLQSPWPVRVSVVTPSKVEMTFDPPYVSTWNSDAVGFRVTYSVYNFDDSPENSSDSKIFTLELPMLGQERKTVELYVENLVQFRHYVFNVQSFNRQGSSQPSDGVFVYVSHSLPKFSLDNFKATPIGSSEILLTWDKWSRLEEQINGFKVIYKPVDNSTLAFKQDVVNGHVTKFILTDLRKFTEYQLQMAVFNRAGASPWTNPPIRARTFADKPGPVGQLTFLDVLLDSVNVTWTPPAEPNGELLGYVIVYKTYKMAGEYIEQIQEKTAHPFLPVKNLEENLTAIFSVQAETATGYGPQVVGTVVIGPQPGSPLAPSRPEILPSENSVRLTWSEPEDAGGSLITSYIIQHMAKRQQKRSNEKRRTRDVSEMPIEQHWATLATLEQTGSQHSSMTYLISYAQLRPDAAFHRFRVIAQNQHGVSYPSPASDPVIVPEGSGREEPFYVRWWFLAILVLISLVIICALVAVLYWAGKDRKFDYDSHGSASSSVQAMDGGAIVAYEMCRRRSSKHAAVTASTGIVNAYMVGDQPPPSRPSPFDPDHLGSRVFDDVIGGLDNGKYRRNGDFVKQANLGKNTDGSTSLLKRLAAMASPPRGTPRSAARRENSDDTNVCRLGATEIARKTPSFYETLQADSDDWRGDAKMGRNGADLKLKTLCYNEPEVSSIVQHYQTSTDLACHRENWRQAVKSAAQRLDDCSSHSSFENNDASPSSYRAVGQKFTAQDSAPHSHVNNAPLGKKNRTQMPGFSSFV